MDVLHRCAGLDVHQKTIMACARLAAADGVAHHVQVFGTTTRDLLALATGSRPTTPAPGSRSHRGPRRPGADRGPR
jgi:hypothetical protein